MARRKKKGELDPQRLLDEANLKVRNKLQAEEVRVRLAAAEVGKALKVLPNEAEALNAIAMVTATLIKLASKDRYEASTTLGLFLNAVSGYLDDSMGPQDGHLPGCDCEDKE